MIVTSSPVSSGARRQNGVAVRVHQSTVAFVTFCLLALTVPASAQLKGVPKPCRSGPKNLIALNQSVCPDATPAPHELTKKDIKNLTKTAKTPEDHLKIAQYYKTEADHLDALAAGYEKVATNLRESPQPKNLVAPGTPGRYEYTAKLSREEAALDRQRAAAQEKLAK
jgi:hypothetical protein